MKTSRVLPSIASPVTTPSSAASFFDGRSAMISVSSTSAAARTWSVISRFTCMSCQARYGLRVATAAATKPQRDEPNTRRPIS